MMNGIRYHRKLLLHSSLGRRFPNELQLIDDNARGYATGKQKQDDQDVQRDESAQQAESQNKEDVTTQEDTSYHRGPLFRNVATESRRTNIATQSSAGISTSRQSSITRESSTHLYRSPPPRLLSSLPSHITLPPLPPPPIPTSTEDHPAFQPPPPSSPLRKSRSIPTLARLKKRDSKNISPLSPWSDSHKVTRIRQLVNVGNEIHKYLENLKNNSNKRQSEDRLYRLLDSLRSPLLDIRLAPPSANHSPSSPRRRAKLILQAQRALFMLASHMHPEANPLHARYAHVVAAYLSQSLLAVTRYTSMDEARKLAAQAGQQVLRLSSAAQISPQDEQRLITALALRAQGLAHQERHQKSLQVAASAMQLFLPILQQQYKRGQQPDVDAIRNSCQFQEMAQLLHSILETQFRRIVLQLRPQTSSSAKPIITSTTSVPRRTQRLQMFAIQRKTSGQFLRQTKGGRNPRKAIARVDEIVRLFQSLLPHGHLLSLATGMFPGPMRVLDDLTAALSTDRILALVDDAAAAQATTAEDVDVAVQSILAMGASLIRTDRMQAALALYLHARKRHNIRLSERFARLIIRAASRSGSDEIVDVVVSSLLDQTKHIEAKTWMAMGGHLARRGKHTDLSLLWRRFLEAHPSQAGSDALRDQHLIAYARSPDTLTLFRRHLIQHWNVPSSLCSSAENQGRTAEPSRRKPMDQLAFLSAIQAHAHFGDLQGAEMYLDYMNTHTPFRNNVTAYNTLISACAKIQDYERASAIWKQMGERGVVYNEASYVTMAMLLAHRGDMQSALSLLGAQQAAGIPLRPSVLVVIMSKLTAMDEFDKAIDIFRSLSNRQDVEIPVAAYNCMLKILVRRAAPYHVVMSTIRSMQEAGYAMDSTTYLLAIQSACDADRIVEAEDLFAQLDREHQDRKEAKSKTSTTRKGDQQEKDDDDEEQQDTIEYVKDETDLFSQGVKGVHFTVLIHTHLRLGNVNAAKEYFDEMQQRELANDPYVWSILAKSYVETGTTANMRLARDIVMRQIENEESQKVDLLGESSSFSTKNVLDPYHRVNGTQVLLGPLLYDASKQGDTTRVESILEEIASKGVDLSIETLTMAMDSYNRSGNLDGMLALWDRIFEKAVGSAREPNAAPGLLAHVRRQKYVKRAVEPSEEKIDEQIKVAAVQRNALCVPLSIVLDALSTHDRHEDVLDVWLTARRYGFAFDPYNWNQLATSLARMGRFEDSIKVLENVLNEMPSPDREERRVEMERLIRGAFTRDGESRTSGVLRGDDQIISPARQVQRREVQKKRQSRIFGEAFASAQEGREADEQDHDQEEDDDDDDGDDGDDPEGEEATSSSPLLSRFASAAIRPERDIHAALKHKPRSFYRNRHPILQALLDQEAVERAGYTWRPRLATRSAILKALSSHIGVTRGQEEMEVPEMFELVRTASNQGVFKQYPKALQVLQYHVQGRLKDAEEVANEAARMLRQAGDG